MKANGSKIGFWHSVFPNQLGNLCLVLFLIGLALFVLHAGFNLNVFDPDDFKSMDERIPALGTRRVVDEAGVLTQDEINALTAQIDAYEAASKGQMAVLLISSLHGDPVEEFSLAVAEKWKIGWRGEDNGVLLLLAVDDHEDRLEIGYGLEGVINDARAGDILRGMMPYLRRGQYAQAISFAIAGVSAFVLNENAPEAPGETDDEDADGSYVSHRNVPEETLFCVIAILIVLQLIGTITARIMIHPDVKKSIGLIVMIVILRILLEVLKGMLRSRGGGGHGGGSGGRSGGGGGSFGGGGASGKW